VKLRPFELMVNGRRTGCVMEPTTGPLLIDGEVTMHLVLRKRWWAPLGLAWAFASVKPWWQRPYFFFGGLLAGFTINVVAP